MGFERAAARGRANRPESRAETAVFQFFERSWAADLKGRRIPTALRKTMRRDPQFVAMVDHYAAHGELAIDETPRFARQVDGRTVDKLAQVLGDAPEPYFCECGEEKGHDDVLCIGCREAEARFQN